MDNQYGNQMNNGGQQMYQQPMYQQPMYQQPMRPFSPMKTDRGLLKFILLIIITCGIYSIVFFSSLGENSFLTRSYSFISFWLTDGDFREIVSSKRPCEIF